MKHKAVLITTTRHEFEFDADLATPPSMLILEAWNAVEECTAHYVAIKGEEKIELIED